ncbi:hypothetical protein IE81DRAFT_168479 [Ceraceosorus guamensis]|uniref:Uncharacterized protein n=1 Tax=Ceraceosorus guamensis TaxID=1522189 RepID=A0A316VXH8_9BASI|nr:hypothetical protein IE81DRAFT_168479 [Ceraceosorus guamensis]PWN41598.1 hypothetical protein IE81DRAFT_168479 [Ceraceosorus guamensis]
MLSVQRIRSTLSGTSIEGAWAEEVELEFGRRIILRSTRRGGDSPVQPEGKANSPPILRRCAPTVRSRSKVDRKRRKPRPGCLCTGHRWSQPKGSPPALTLKAPLRKSQQDETLPCVVQQTIERPRHGDTGLRSKAKVCSPRRR